MTQYRRSLRPRRMQLESLESRHLLSAAPLESLPLSLGNDCLLIPEEYRPLAQTSAGEIAPAPSGAAWNDTSEFMLGDVWVTVVLLESDGTYDAQSEDWTATEINQVKAEINEGLTWWEDTLAVDYPTMPLDFHIDFTYADSPVATAYEPIGRPQSDQGLWINSFLTLVGENTGNYFDDLYRWNHQQRLANDCDWAYTIFVADSSQDVDNMFTDGYFAYAYLGGPFTVMTYGNDGWGIDYMGQVLAHETGHIFYALDEYPGSGHYTDRSGYYNTQNLNARDGHPTPWTRVNSLMAESSLQIPAYQNHTSSRTSLEMVGWRDSDRDGILDVVDVPILLTGQITHDPMTRTVDFTGNSAVRTLANQNPYPWGNRNDITINTVDRVEYRIDGGTWQQGAALDGDASSSVAQSLTLPDDGAHSIQFRTICTRTGAVSTPLEFNVEGNAPKVNLRFVDGGASGFSPETAQTGEAFSAWFEVENDGLLASDPFEVDLYLSTDMDITTLDTLIGTVSVASLAAGDSTVVRLDLASLPYIDEGYYYVGCLIDPENAVTEQDESDNVGLHAAREVHVLSPTARSAIEGVVYNDVDGDGLQGPLEPGLEGWTVYIDENGNGQYDAPGATTYIVRSEQGMIIPDDGQVESVIDVAGTGRIADLNVTLNISHTFDADLDIDLISPSGTTITLLADVGRTGDNFTETVLDDEAELSIREGEAPFTGRFRPLEPLSTFDARQITGAWTLRVVDDTQTDWGTLDNWSLEFSLAEAAEPLTTSGPDGRYEFTHLEPGTYTVRQVDQVGWNPTEQQPVPAETQVVASGSQLHTLRPPVGPTNWDPDRLAIAGGRLVFEQAGTLYAEDLMTGERTAVSSAAGSEVAVGPSYTPALSNDGRFVVFVSESSSLVPGDTNGRADIFRKDLLTGDTVLVSTSGEGVLGNGESFSPSVSADGRYVAFQSFASNLIAGDTNGRPDIFVKDLQTGAVTRASVSSSGVQANQNSFSPSISADGRYVAFMSVASNLVPGDTNGRNDSFVHDLESGTTLCVNRDSDGVLGNGHAYGPHLSADGRYVTFNSTSNNLVPGDTNGVYDVFVRDLATGLTTRVSTSSAGTQSDAVSKQSTISADGRYVTFFSEASNLVPGDTNSRSDVFVKDLLTGEITRVSITPAGEQALQHAVYPRIAPDVGMVAYYRDSETSPGLFDVFVYEFGYAAEHTVTLALGERATHVDFGNQAYAITGDVTGYVWDDTDADGERDAGEAGLGGWTVYADLNGNGRFDPSAEKQVAYEATPYLDIPDLDVCSTTITVPDGGTILDLNVTLDITHWWDADLDVKLIGPGGETIRLFDDVGGLGKNFTNTTLDDEAPLAITQGMAPFTGAFRPEEALEAFDGLDMQGDWTLMIEDDTMVATGRLNRWSLEFTLPEEPEPSATSGSDGFYQLVGLAPGDYSIRHNVQDVWIPTTPPGGVYDVEVVAGATVADRNFGHRAPQIEDVVYRAVVVGVGDYAGTADDLLYAAADAAAFRDALLTQSNWAPENITLLTDSSATRAAIEAAIAAAAAESDANDAFLLYFAGRGLQGTSDLAPIDEADHRDEYIVPYTPADSETESIRDDELAAWLGSVTADRKMVLLDASRSGGLAGAPRSGDAAEQTTEGDDFAADLITSPDAGDTQGQPATVVLTACAADETAWESTALGHGVFTGHLLEAISGLAADTNGDGALTIEEAFAYVGPRVSLTQPDQHPKLYDAYEGEAVFLGRPTQRLHVDDDAVPGGDGYSWDTALDSLQSALDLAEARNHDLDLFNDVDAIWVAAGTYRPAQRLNPADPRSAAFSILPGVSIYGGFQGHETTLEERVTSPDDPFGSATVLSGDLGVVGDSADNAYTVLFAYEVGNLVLDRLQVTGANADGPAMHDPVNEHLSCGALYAYNSSLTLQDVDFVENMATRWGGAVRVHESGVLTIRGGVYRDNVSQRIGGAINADSTPLDISGATFLRNSATTAAGAIEAWRADAVITSCRFEGNQTLEDERESWGGAIRITSGDLQLSNSSIVNNTAHVGEGGGLWVVGSAVLTNTTIVNNSAGRGGGVFVWAGGNLTLNNSIVTGNAAAAGEEEIGGNFEGQSNLIGVADPLFVREPSAGDDGLLGTLDDDYGNLNLVSGSAAVDAGSNAVVPLDLQDIDGDGNFAETLPDDLGGNRRVSASRIDIGAYESPAEGLVVTIADDESDSDHGPFDLSLREALLVAAEQPDHDTIYFDGALFGRTIAVDADLGDLILCSDVSIIGPGAALLSIDGGAAGRLFALYGDTVEASIAEMTLRDGYAVGQGGAVLASEGSLTLEAVILAHNTAGSGGALAATAGANVELVGCEITKNEAVQGGGLYAGDPQTRIVVRGGTVHENLAVSGAGLMATGGAEVDFQGVTLQDNAATSNGGGLMAHGQETVVRLSDDAYGQASQLLDNTAELYGGGGLATHGATIVLTGGRVSGQSVQALGQNSSRIGGGLAAYRGGRLAIHGTEISANSARLGGGVYVARDDASAQIDLGASISENAANHGGGLFAARGAAVTIDDATFGKNTATAAGGGLAVDGAGSLLTITGTNLIDNAAGRDGGGLYVAGKATANVSDSLISGAGLKAAGTPGAMWGAGVFAKNGGQVRITRTEISDHLARSGAAIYAGRAAAEVELVETRILRNTAEQFGGGLHIAAGADATITGSLLAENTASKGGGGLFATGPLAGVSIEASTVRNNTALFGGGLQFGARVSAVLTTTTITSNVATALGGGVWVSTVATAEADSEAATRITGNSSVSGRDSDVAGVIDYLAAAEELPGDIELALLGPGDDQSSNDDEAAEDAPVAAVLDLVFADLS